VPGPLRVLGIRHGEVHNPGGVIYAGLAGFGLSDYGRSQAADVAKALAGAPIAAIYASPLDRAVQTASAISEATGVPIAIDDRLHEWRFWSSWAGLTWEELRERALDSWEAYQADPGSVAGEESLAQLAERMTSWMDDVERAHSEGIVVGVSHLEPLRSILLDRTGRPAKDLFDVRIGLAQAVRLSPEPDPTALGPQELAALLHG
jgi:probable phosphoglycerate mutase